MPLGVQSLSAHETDLASNRHDSASCDQGRVCGASVRIVVCLRIRQACAVVEPMLQMACSFVGVYCS